MRAVRTDKSNVVSLDAHRRRRVVAHPPASAYGALDTPLNNHRTLAPTPRAALCSDGYFFRPSLYDALNTLLKRPVGLIVGPAKLGKTTLVRHYLSDNRIAHTWATLSGTVTATRRVVADLADAPHELVVVDARHHFANDRRLVGTVSALVEQSRKRWLLIGRTAGHLPTGKWMGEGTMDLPLEALSLALWGDDLEVFVRTMLPADVAEGAVDRAIRQCDDQPIGVALRMLRPRRPTLATHNILHG